MARVKLAKTAGFCMGVRRAVDTALETAMRKDGPIYTYGPLIHNPQVLEVLEAKGIKSFRGWEGGGGDFPCSGEDRVSTMIIRAHGVSPEERQKIKSTGARILDATCPHVGRVQGIIKRYAKEGYATVIVGERDHAEVIGLLGYTRGKGYVVDSPEEIESLPPFEKVCLVAQTTQDRYKFETYAQAIQRRYPRVKIFNTICESTNRRQDEVLALAGRVKAMVVVGGKGSGNTRRLAQISRDAGVPTFHVETEKDLDLEELSRHSSIGITAGASTPNWLILKVIERVKGLGPQGGGVHFLETLARFASMSYLTLALGAGCLTYANIVIQGLQPRLSWFLIASFYVFSMHVLNRLTDKDSEKYTQPGRMEFYERYGNWMIGAGIGSAVISLILAWVQGALPFLLLLAIMGLGIIYNMPIFPARLGKSNRHRKLKDIPGSKTIAVAMAWAVVSSLLPPLADGGNFLPATGIAFLFSSILVFTRSMLYDFRDIQGDLMVGKETLPIVLGRRKAEGLVIGLLILLGAGLTLAGLRGWASSATPFLLLALGYVVLYYLLYRFQVLRPGLIFEGMVDGSFVFAGLLAFIGTTF